MSEHNADWVRPLIEARAKEFASQTKASPYVAGFVDALHYVLDILDGKPDGRHIDGSGGAS